MMRRPLINSLLYSVIALGIVGFLYKLINEPTSILRTVGFTLVFLLILYVFFTYILRSGQQGSQNRDYIRAVKQSKSRLRERTQKQADVRSLKKNKRPNKLHTIKKRKETHLTVIEGKKGKKKNRAFF
jgi:Ca2+/Na+ antiporter